MTWLDILRSKVAASSMSAVARELGLGTDPDRPSHTAISLALAGKYPASTAKLALKVMTRWGSVACPFLERELSYAECRDYHEAEAPTSSQFDMRHWRACQGCPNNHKQRGIL